MAEPNIVIVGHVCVDDNVTEGAAYTKWGSTALYIAQYLQTSYHLVPLVVSNYGPDLMPYLPVVDMIPDKPNQAKTLLYENNTTVSPRIRRAHNVEFAGPPKLTPQVIAALQEADILVVPVLLPNYPPNYLKELISHLKPECLRVLSAQGYFHYVKPNGRVVHRDFTEVLQLAPFFDLVIYSEEDHPKAHETAKAWSAAAEQASIIVTQGPNGASIYSAGKVQQVSTTPIPPEKIIDSVGCGDIFSAALTYTYYTKRDLVAAVEQAHRAAGQKLLSPVRTG